MNIGACAGNSLDAVESSIGTERPGANLITRTLTTSPLPSTAVR